MPKYKIHQESQIDDRLVSAGQEIETHDRHIPGPHWEPVDDHAKAVAQRHGVLFTGQVPDPTDKLSLQLADEMSRQGMSADMVAAAISRSLGPILEKLSGPAVDEEAMQKRIDEAVERALASRKK